MQSILQEEQMDPTKNDSSVDEFAPVSAIANDGNPLWSESESDNPLSDSERAKKVVRNSVEQASSEDEQNLK